MKRMLAGALASMALVTGCGGLQAADIDTDPQKAPSADVGGARKDLDKLEVKGRAPKTGFEREKFGPAWADVDHNGCGTRDDILKRDLRDETFKAGTHDCVVLTGVLDDPYSGKTIHFKRGQDTSSAVQIDHLIPLSDAWQKGAQQWTKDKRKEFANDPLNLLAVDGPLNGQKSDADAATWLPPRKAYRCAYIVRQVKVKTKYALWVTEAEKTAMKDILSSC
ncbi:HNH endonuclease family protein [Nonomuraea sp. NPDC049152]|uniref:HNH endonuclease family protein n=1 Tax=Nonomuraea sp. NPDC049152 TaxID=3154350 RepID=UPI0033EFE495